MTTEELEAKGINQSNYLLHLEELTDRQITRFLDREQGWKRLESVRAALPNIPDRVWAEQLRNHLQEDAPCTTDISE